MEFGDDEYDAELGRVNTPGLDAAIDRTEVIPGSGGGSVDPNAEDVIEQEVPHLSIDAVSGILPSTKHDLKQLASSGQAGRVLYIFEKVSGVQIDLAEEED